MDKRVLTAIANSKEIRKSFVDFCQNEGLKFLYGNGEQTATVLSFLRQLDVKVDGCLTLPGYQSPILKGFWGDMLKTVNTCNFSSLDRKVRKEASVLMTVPREHYFESRELLIELGFEKVYGCDWERNQIIRDILNDERRE